MNKAISVYQSSSVVDCIISSDELDSALGTIAATGFCFFFVLFVAFVVKKRNSDLRYDFYRNDCRHSATEFIG